MAPVSQLRLNRKSETALLPCITLEVLPVVQLRLAVLRLATDDTGEDEGESSADDGGTSEDEGESED